MKGKRVLVTGGTGGIGVATARALAGLGADVVVTGRDRDRGEAVVAALKSAGAGDARLVLGDLTSRRGVDAIAEGCAAVGNFDVVIHNAGLMPGALARNDDGVEVGFAVNVIAPLLLTQRLLPLLAPAARIVAVTGGSHPRRFELDNLQGERRFEALALYSHHKLVMMATMRALARTLTGHTVNVCYPGQASTAMTQAVKAGDLPLLMRPFFPLFKLLTRDDGGRSAEKASRSSVHLASSPVLQSVTGRYFDPSCRERRWPAALDDKAAGVAVARTAALAGIDGWLSP